MKTMSFPQKKLQHIFVLTLSLFIALKGKKKRFNVLKFQSKLNIKLVQNKERKRFIIPSYVIFFYHILNTNLKCQFYFVVEILRG